MLPLRDTRRGEVSESSHMVVLTRGLQGGGGWERGHLRAMGGWGGHLRSAGGWAAGTAPCGLSWGRFARGDVNTARM